ncbi:hypothetical protein [Gimesia sp.]|uniref:hypothetical protein n=1 Tax=Gimesia sp. TaxID=2024833 RepID=UPI003A931B34
MKDCFIQNAWQPVCSPPSPLLWHRAQTDIKRRLVCHDNSDLKAGEMMDLIDRMKDIASRIPKQMYDLFKYSDRLKAVIGEYEGGKVDSEVAGREIVDNC